MFYIKILIYDIMVSYSNTGYENDFFYVSDVYFNSTSQSSGSAVDLDELDARYLLKTGGTVSSNLIVSGSVDVKTGMTLPIIGEVEDAIQEKQNELTAGANITIEGDEVSCDLTGSTNIDITSGVISPLNLATTTQLDDKQDEINESTSLNITSITTNALIVNESLNMDRLITYEKYKQFNTIVIRRADETDFEIIDLQEIQCWVNDVNILNQNINSLTGYFSRWSNNGVEIDPTDAGSPVIRYVIPYMVDNTFTSGYASQSKTNSNTNAIIFP